MNKTCYIRLTAPAFWAIDERYLRLSLSLDDSGDLMCHLGSNDDWELSYTGPDAADKCNALLDVEDEVDIDYVYSLGLTQYG